MECRHLVAHCKLSGKRLLLARLASTSIAGSGGENRAVCGKAPGQRALPATCAKATTDDIATSSCEDLASDARSSAYGRLGLLAELPRERRDRLEVPADLRR